MSKQFNLAVIPNLKVELLPDGRVAIEQKFLEGILKYDGLWSGSVTVLMEKNPDRDKNFHKKIFKRDELPFKLEIISSKEITPQKLLENKISVVLASADYRKNHLSQVCHSANLPCIYITEYSLQTRKQIIAANTNNPLLRLRRNLWEENQERKQRKAIALAEGVQCNGTPTYEAYRTINRNPLLYFDGRVTEAMLATKEEIEKRFLNCKEDRPLRLLFSGRLIKMKGADRLLDVARELKHSGIQFEMFICGDGDLREKMQREIVAARLKDRVKMMGVLDFKTELIPFAKANVDLFVCCHPQGDPSCTYLETMSCGVPIVGYANEAFEGVVKYSQAGWLIPMDRPKLIAQQLAALSQNRHSIKAMSLKALEFARQHTFEKTWEARISHLKRVAMRKMALESSMLH
ncbi:glycosyltransferase [Pleurocapsa sp. PCC 7327]|uniref:glycosyltransferase family 4 protein n=1 Tax=Pleurocapsa sp. PCC 7327 TaxID=118163 RepID=UPI00029FDC14|nr:glycosyltransferase family 4 protein [Pleurocapsa sp. PCC 7327]AFY77361.1 glycosyltransferase [Pleurocapsa sp. PCC 7327]